ncbi:sugar ABC transporter permease [Streptomyces sp. NPDC005805]|uniref:sugar ABC transporter permease n=1 Tax=Streptomyces sp. NPDC005805 TaxID=3157068 RepID=UPI0033DF52DD
MSVPARDNDEAVRDTAWAEAALDAVLARVAVTRAEVGDRFPLYADPATGRWTTTRRGSWTGGFWAGLLWLRARRTGAADDLAAAVARTRALAPWAEADTATRGLIVWYGTALADRGAGAAEAAELRERAARSCLAAFDPGLGLVPWGDALGGDRAQARTDGLPGMLQLLACAGPDGVTAAVGHLGRHLGLCLGGGGGEADGGVRPAWRYGGAGSGRGVGLNPAPDAGSGWQPCEEPGPGPGSGLGPDAGSGWQACAEPGPGWARGRAWLLLAVADALLHPEAARRLRPGPAARRIADGLLGGPLVPLADTAHPAGSLDTSAAAITAVALLKLARAEVPDAERYGARGVAVLRRLTTAHLSGAGGPVPAAPGPRAGAGPRTAGVVPPAAPRLGGRAADRGVVPDGMLLDGCYDAARGTAMRHELIWGDFFLALGLAALTGSVGIDEV